MSTIMHLGEASPCARPFPEDDVPFWYWVFFPLIEVFDLEFLGRRKHAAQAMVLAKLHFDRLTGYRADGKFYECPPTWTVKIAVVGFGLVDLNVSVKRFESFREYEYIDVTVQRPRFNSCQPLKVKVLRH